MNKYGFTGETKEFRGRTLHRIVALKDFGNVKKGDVGGWVEKEENLSQEGAAWVGDSAMVIRSATVSDSAKVFGSAFVGGSAIVRDSATVCGSAIVHGEAIVRESAWVGGSSHVCDSARVCGSATVHGEATVSDLATVRGSAWVCGSAIARGSAVVGDDAKVFGSATVSGMTNIRGGAWVRSIKDHITIGPLGSRDGYTTFFKEKSGEITVTCGCFLGTIDEFRKKVAETHGTSKFAKEYLAAADLAETHIKGE